MLQAGWLACVHLNILTFRMKKITRKYYIAETYVTKDSVHTFVTRIFTSYRKFRRWRLFIFSGQEHLKRVHILRNNGTLAVFNFHALVLNPWRRCAYHMTPHYCLCSSPLGTEALRYKAGPKFYMLHKVKK